MKRVKENIYKFEGKRKRGKEERIKTIKEEKRKRRKEEKKKRGKK